MNKKGRIISALFTLVITALITVSFLSEESYAEATSIYQVYLDGNKIGLINSKDELYELINKEQTEIKDAYNVDQVYPPKGFKIIKKNTYDDNITTVEDIYEYIKDDKSFTLKGYTITIKSKEDDVEPRYIYVLDQEVFKEALEEVVKIFIGEERFNQYLTNSQPEVVDLGYIIEKMYFQENISIKESYVSSSEKIFTDVTELTKYLLFNENISTKEYTVAQGDTIAKIAEANEMNVTELLIANDDIESEDTLLAIGQKLNVAIINPVLNLTYEELVTDDVRVYYETEYIDDNTLYVGTRKTKQAGENGIERVTNRIQLINGVQTELSERVGVAKTIKAPVNEIILKGTKKYSISIPPNAYVDPGDSNWLWPTDSSYYITSSYGWRTLYGVRDFHDGLDIPRPNGSPIYASLDGVVIHSGWGGPAGRAAGINVVIDHGNGYTTVYAHCSRTYVKVGQTVSKGQTIAAVGLTGTTTGYHLHFGLFKGVPYSQGKGLNPLQLWN